MIVSNTTPLSCLLKIEKAQALQALYGSITIPSEVAAELDQAGALHDGWRQQLDFVKVADPITSDPIFTLLSADLDPGEAAPIALGRRLNSELLIVDDMAGRRMARRLGLTITGTVGVIVAAADRGLFHDPFAVLEDLRKRGGLWLSDAFLQALRSTWHPSVRPRDCFGYGP